MTQFPEQRGLNLAGVVPEQLMAEFPKQKGNRQIVLGAHAHLRVKPLQVFSSGYWPMVAPLRALRAESRCLNVFSAGAALILLLGTFPRIPGQAWILQPSDQFLSSPANSSSYLLLA